MGSGTSRGKKVAPACVSELKGTTSTSGETSPKQESRPFKPLKIQSILRNARNRAQPECHSEGHDSDFSREEDDIDGEMDTVIADYEEREKTSVKKTPPKKIVIRSKTYGLCPFSQEDEKDFSSEEPRGSHGGSGDVNKRSSDASTQPACPSQHSSSQGFLTRGALLEAVPTSEKQSDDQIRRLAAPLSLPAIMYDGSEEELMNTIEKEFN
ncbi:Aspartyl/glutamyl-tRNA(Asn/Gln) amidotransferase subunit B [Dissostichus eleginoides]|uniref:Aspartyl/glutamyl-tRNA(Asn/Gln) amidotransferase subunit B n=1 Tax=Dissostichus eleginoides TaxID=100907 RepID=A0AAD9C0A8_DISEL|nr:Aspartyl/glutamyl-tRNA(Asn/Gln) amidotransferase subunit B [Dissostichus eleginoides]